MNMAGKLVERLFAHRNSWKRREHFRNPYVVAKYAKRAEQKPWVPVMQRKRQGGRV